MLPGQTLAPEDILRIVWRRKWLILVPFVVITAAVYVYARKLPDAYRSETLILVVPQRVPESYVRSTVTSRIEDRLTTIQQQILSRSRLESIILDFNLYATERQTLPMEDIVERMRRPEIIGLRIERGDAFRVSYVNENPRLAQRVAERLASLFIEENLREREVLAEGTNSFLDAQLEDSRRRLIEQEKRLEVYRRRYAGELPTQVEANLQAVQNAQLQLQALTESLNRDKDRRRDLERQIVAVENAPEAVVVQTIAPPAPAAQDSPAQQLEAATTLLRALEQRYKPEHPDVIATRRRVRELTAALGNQAGSRSEPSSTPDRPTVSRADAARQAQLQTARAELAALDKQIAVKETNEKAIQETVAGYLKKVDAAPTRESELVELTRDYSTMKAAYDSLVAKREESKLSANLERRQVGEQFKVLDPARVPERPFSPNRLQMTAMGAAGGLALGLALLGLLEYRDRSLKTPDQVLRVLQLPVLALIPRLEVEADRLARRRRRIVASAAAAVLASAAGVAYVVWFRGV